MRTVLLSYGLCGAWPQLAPVADRLRPLGVNPIVTRFRGHDGQPESWVKLAWRKYAGLAQDVIDAATLHPSGSGEKTILVGHSQGAAASHIAAQMRPDLFGAAVLLAPALCGGVTEETERALKGRARYWAAMLMLRPFRIHPEDVKSLFFNGYLHSPRERATAAAMARQPAATAALKEGLGRTLTAPAVPTVVVVAKRDRVLKPEDQRAWAERHGLSVVEVDCHHMGAVLEAEQVVRIVREHALRA